MSRITVVTQVAHRPSLVTLVKKPPLSHHLHLAMAAILANRDAGGARVGGVITARRMKPEGPIRLLARRPDALARPPRGQRNRNLGFPRRCPTPRLGGPRSGITVARMAGREARQEHRDLPTRVINEQAWWALAPVRTALIRRVGGD